jgi:hypothetical protein
MTLFASPETCATGYSVLSRQRTICCILGSAHRCAGRIFEERRAMERGQWVGILSGVAMLVMPAMAIGQQIGAPIPSIPRTGPLPGTVPATPTLPSPTLPSTQLPSPTLSPTLTVPQAATSGAPPPEAATSAQRRVKRCWCYARNPATNSSYRTTCGIECCTGSGEEPC